jgi:hypothetical protein
MAEEHPPLLDTGLLTASMFVGDVIGGHGLTRSSRLPRPRGAGRRTAVRWSRPCRT